MVWVAVCTSLFFLHCQVKVQFKGAPRGTMRGAGFVFKEGVRKQVLSSQASQIWGGLLQQMCMLPVISWRGGYYTFHDC
jgi:hypothetical protein